MHQPPLFPPDIRQLHFELAASGVPDQHGDIVDRGRVVLPSVAPAVPVTPHVDRIEAGRNGNRGRRAGDHATFGAGSGVQKLPHILAPKLLLPAAVELAARAAVQFELPTFQILEIDQRVRILAALGPRELVGLLTDLLPGFDFVDGRQDFLRRFRAIGERKSQQTGQGDARRSARGR